MTKIVYISIYSYLTWKKEWNCRLAQSTHSRNPAGTSSSKSALASLKACQQAKAPCPLSSCITTASSDGEPQARSNRSAFLGRACVAVTIYRTVLYRVTDSPKNKIYLHDTDEIMKNRTAIFRKLFCHHKTFSLLIVTIHLVHMQGCHAANEVYPIQRGGWLEPTITIQ